MPLKNGSSDKTVSANIATMVDEYMDAGHIGNSHPETKQMAVKQAVAIALTKAGKSRKQAAPKTKKAK